MQIRVCLNASAADYGSDGLSQSLEDHTDLVDAIIGYGLLRRHNVTRKYFSLENPHNSAYSSCLHAVSSNAADVTVDALPHNELYDNENITLAHPWDQYDPSFASFYHKQEMHKSPDLLDFTKDISMFFFSAIILSMISLFGLSLLRLIAHRHRKGQNSRPVKLIPALCKLGWRFTSYILGNWAPIGFLRRNKLTYLLIILVIVILRYACLITMRTEKVVALPPLKMDTVDQLIKHQVTFIWPARKGYEIFLGSISPKIQKLLELTRSRGLSSAMLVQENEEPDRIRYFEQLNRLIQQQSVYVFTSAVHDAQKELCVFLLYTGARLNGYAITRTYIDAVPRVMIGSYISRSLFTKHPFYARLVQSSLRKFLESGMLDNYRKTGSVYDSSSQCDLNLEFNPVLFAPALLNLKNLLIVCSLLLISAIACLLIENCRSKRRSIRVTPSHL
jgi:hypothetical protein